LVATALSWHESGMDFADAMHLGRAEGCEAFVSFDKGLAKTAAKVSRMPVRAP
jgi:predicted nucleic-acid-binding protein